MIPELVVMLIFVSKLLGVYTKFSLNLALNVKLSDAQRKKSFCIIFTSLHFLNLQMLTSI
jgi:hypothetical protein